MNLKIKHNRRRRVLESRSGGGCVGALGAIFALWCSLLAAGVVWGWRRGDFSAEEFVIGATPLAGFILCGLGVATYRDRYRFHGDFQTVTRITNVLFLPVRWRRWSFKDFEAVQLREHRRHSGGQTMRFHIVQLLPAKDAPGPSQARELGGGTAGKETRAMAQEIADFCRLPLLQGENREAVRG